MPPGTIRAWSVWSVAAILCVEPLEWTVFCAAAALTGVVVVVMVARRLSAR